MLIGILFGVLWVVPLSIYTNLNLHRGNLSTWSFVAEGIYNKECDNYSNCISYIDNQPIDSIIKHNWRDTATPENKYI